MTTGSKSSGGRKASSRRRGSREATAVSPNGGVGGTLRELRQARDLSLADVAKGTSISASFLSMVENGRSDITIGRLIRLMEFYGVSLADLLPDTRGSEPDIVQAHERRRLHSPTEGLDVYMLGTETERGMIPTLLTFEPGAGRKRCERRHAGQVFLFVLEGELILELEGSAPKKLKAGDAAFYPGARPHLLRNGSKRRALRLIRVDATSPD